MDYRNDRDALRGRVEELEQALDEARRGERITRLEAELMEADVLARRLRDELSALQEARARGASVRGVDVLEAEIVRAERLIQRHRALVREVEQAPEQAGALIRRLQRDLSGIEAVKPLGPRVIPLDPRFSPSTKVGMALAGMALVTLGAAFVARHAQAHREACNQAAVCCHRSNTPVDGLCRWAQSNCEEYVEHWTCDDAPARRR